MNTKAKGTRKNTIADVLAMISPSGDCWMWTGTVHPWNKYGYVRYKGRMWRAHRLMYSIAVGPIPDGLHVCHTCDVPSCVNPLHLFVGTAKDNIADCKAKGRLNRVLPRPDQRARGEDYHRKLTEMQVREIRALHSEGMNYPNIAALFHVHRMTVGEIVRREIWKHVR